MRLRDGFLIQDLAYRFNVSSSLISNISITWIQCMYVEFTEHLKPKMFPSWEQIAQNKPVVFKSFKNIRVILECMEVFSQQPKNFEHQGNVYSQYKAHTTFKLFLGITPNGAISFISEAFEGSIYARQIVTDSNLLDLLEPGNLVLAGRGFTIFRSNNTLPKFYYLLYHIFNKIGVKINPFHMNSFGCPNDVFTPQTFCYSHL